jgi:hypothetical protein
MILAVAGDSRYLLPLPSGLSPFFLSGKTLTKVV